MMSCGNQTVKSFKKINITIKRYVLNYAEKIKHGIKLKVNRTI